MFWYSKSGGLLPTVEVPGEGSVALCRADQDHDGRGAAISLSKDRHRSAAHFNESTVQHVVQFNGLQGKRRPIQRRLIIEALSRRVGALKQGWLTDLCRGWAAHGAWTSLAQAIDRYTRELYGEHQSSSGKGSAALAQALIGSFG